MAVNTGLIKQLREKTGAGVLDCKEALQETEGNLEEAVDLLREKGMAQAEKKSGRLAAEGLIEAYIHHGSKIGVLLELNCETDFVAKTDDFKALARDIAMQIAAQNPSFVSPEDVPEEAEEREKEILKTQALNEGKPEHIVEKIVDGRMGKFYQRECLLEQEFIRDNDLTIEELLQRMIARLGENIKIRRFSRFELGEGLEEKEEDFAAEVQKEMEKE